MSTRTPGRDGSIPRSTRFLVHPFLAAVLCLLTSGCAGGGGLLGWLFGQDDDETSSISVSGVKIDDTFALHPKQVRFSFDVSDAQSDQLDLDIRFVSVDAQGAQGAPQTMTLLSDAAQAQGGAAAVPNPGPAARANRYTFVWDVASDLGDNRSDQV